MKFICKTFFFFTSTLCTGLTAVKVQANEISVQQGLSDGAAAFHDLHSAILGVIPPCCHCEICSVMSPVKVSKMLKVILSVTYTQACEICSPN